VVHWLVLEFAADPTGTVDVAIFAQYGVLGIVAAILIWFAKGAHQRERDRADRMEAENKRLHELILDRIIPALTSATNAAEDSTDLLRAMQRERELATFAQQQTGQVSLRRRPQGGSP
jgi:hypothetical protein